MDSTPSKQLSVTFSLTHGSPPAGSHITSPPNPDKPLAVNAGGDPGHRPPILSLPSSHDRMSHDRLPEPTRDKHHHRHLLFDGAALDATRLRTRHKHKHSKSREGRFPRIMNPIAATGAKGLLPAWSGGRDKEGDADNGLLRPITRETTRSRWGSESTVGYGTGSRKGSLLNDVDVGNKLGLIRPRDIRSAEDLEQVRERRKQGEEFLRSALSFIGTLATDITRRLDYTYYNLLEKIAALNSTMSSFQELSDSTSTLFADFEHETKNLEQDIRKQLVELKGFEPQIQKVESLEERMRVGRTRASALSDRLEAMRAEIDHWEKREMEFQTRVNRRLRIFWAVVIVVVLTAAIVLVIQNWSTAKSSGAEILTGAAVLANGSSHMILQGIKSQSHTFVPNDPEERSFRRPTDHSPEICSSAIPTTTPDLSLKAMPTTQDSLQIFDEL